MFNDKFSSLPLSVEEMAASAEISFSPPVPVAPVWDESAGEGQLSVDVAETADELIVIATMAGTKAADIELHLHNDFLTIRGRRRSPTPTGADYFYQECFWGAFSRTIVLPVDVRSELAEAQFQGGVLTIRLPKAKATNTIPILVVEE